MRNSILVLAILVLVVPCLRCDGESDKQGGDTAQQDTREAGDTDGETRDSSADTREVEDSVDAEDTAIDTPDTADTAPDTADTSVPDTIEETDDTPPDEVEVDLPPEDTEQPDMAEVDDTSVDPTILGTLTVNCDLVANNAYVLDASQISSVVYMGIHFNDLVQQFGITGVVAGADISDPVAYPEMMYFGAHPPDDTYLRLMQISMTNMLAAQYTVIVDFWPDSAVTTGSTWPVGLDVDNAVATLLDNTRNNCLMAIGYGGVLTFNYASGITQVEGGQFTVTGTMEMADPREIPGLCEEFEASVPCCP